MLSKLPGVTVATRGRYAKIGENTRYLVIKVPANKQDSDYERYKALTKPEVGMQNKGGVEYEGDGKTGIERQEGVISEAEKGIENAYSREIDANSELLQTQQQIDDTISAISSAEESSEEYDALKTTLSKQSKRYQQLKTMAASARNTIEVLSKQLQAASTKLENDLAFVSNYTYTKRGADKYVAIDKDAIELGSYQSIGQAFEAFDENADIEAQQKLDTYQNLSPDGLRDLYVHEVMSRVNNKDSTINADIEESIRKIADGMSPEDINVELVNLWSRDIKDNYIKNALRSGAVYFKDEEEAQNFMNDNGIGKDSKPRPMVARYCSLEAAFKYLSDEDRQKIGITGTIDDYNEDVYSNAKKYATENGMSEADTRALMEGLQIDKLVTKGKPFYPVASSDSHSLLITEANRNNPNVNTWIRKNRQPGANYLIGQAWKALETKYKNILKIANGEIKDKDGKTVEVQPKRDSILVRYMDDNGIIHSRYVGQFYEDEDGISRWLPDFKELKRYATEITCNFSVYLGKLIDESRVSFKLIPNSIVQGNNMDQNDAEIDTDIGYNATSAEMKGEIDELNELLDSYTVTGEWRQKLEKKAYSILFNHYKHLYKDMLTKARDATDESVAGYVGMADFYRDKMAECASLIGGESSATNEAVQQTKNAVNKYRQERENAQTTSVSYTDKLRDAKARYEELVSNPVYSEDTDNGIFTVERELLSRLMIPYYEQMAQREDPAELQNRYIISDAQLQRLADKYASKSGLPTNPAAYYHDLYVLKKAADAGYDVAATRSKAIAAYHEARMSGMSDAERVDYKNEVAEYAQSHPDAYTIDPNAKYGDEIVAEAKRKVGNDIKKAKNRLKAIDKMADNYKRPRDVQKALDQLNDLEAATNQDTSKLRERLQKTLDRLANPQRAVAETAIDEMFPDETAQESVEETIESNDSSNDSQAETIEEPQKAEPITSFRGNYSFLSNMSNATFTWDGRTYTNSEAAFQSAKSDDPAVRDTFSNMTGKAAKQAGRKVNLRNGWNNDRVAVMEEILRAKFGQNPELMQKLLATGNADLTEGNTWNDKFWGVDANTGVGQNNLGKILMKIRDEELQKPQKVEPQNTIRDDYEHRWAKNSEQTRGFVWNGKIYFTASDALNDAKKQYSEEEWAKVEESTEYEILKAKFSQNGGFLFGLLNSKGSNITTLPKEAALGLNAKLYANMHDTGKNLMKLRDEFSSELARTGMPYNTFVLAKRKEALGTIDTSKMRKTTLDAFDSGTRSHEELERSYSRRLPNYNKGTREFMKDVANSSTESSITETEQSLAPFTINLQRHSEEETIPQASVDATEAMLDNMNQTPDLKTGNEQTIKDIKNARNGIIDKQTYEDAINVYVDHVSAIKNLQQDIDTLARKIEAAKDKRTIIKATLDKIAAIDPAVQTDADRNKYDAYNAHYRALGRKMSNLIKQKQDLEKERNERKSKADSVANYILASEIADQIVNNKAAIHYKAFQGKDADADFRAARLSGNESANALEKAAKGYKVLQGGETSFTPAQLAAMFKAAISERQLSIDRELGKALGHRVRSLKEEVALLEFKKAILTESEEAVVTKAEATIAKIMELYPEREYTDTERARYLSMKDRITKNVYDLYDSFSKEYGGVNATADRDQMFRKIQLDIDVLSAAIERGENIVTNYYRNSAENIEEIFAGNFGGHLPAAILRTNFALLRNAAKKWNPVKFKRETIDTFPRLIRAMFTPEVTELFHSQYITPVRVSEAKLTKEREEIHSEYDYMHGKYDTRTREAITKSIDKGYSDTKIRSEYSDIADDVIEGKNVAVGIFRRLNQEINVVYGRNGIDLLKRRKNYVPHIKIEDNGFFGKVMDFMGLHIGLTEIPTEMLGRSPDYHPLHEYFRFANEREYDNMENCEKDIVKLLDIYVPAALVQIHHTDNIVRLEDMMRTIDESGNYTDMGKELSGGLSVFRNSLEEYKNAIAGKKVGHVDRALEAKASRKFFVFMRALSASKGQSATAGNLNITFANMIPLKNCFAMCPKQTLLAFYDTFKSHVYHNDREMLEKSPNYVVRTSERGRPENAYQKYVNILHKPASISDDIATEIITRAMQYNIADKMGIDHRGSSDLHQQMIITADNSVINLMASKGRGEKIQALNSATWGTVFQFLQEPVNNLWHMYSDLPKFIQSGKYGNAVSVVEGSAKALVTIVAMLLGSELINWAAGRQTDIGPITDVRKAIKNRKEDDSVLDVALAAANNIKNDLNPMDNLIDPNNDIPLVGGIPAVSGVASVATNTFESAEHAWNAIQAKYNRKEYNPTETDFVTDIMSIVSEIAPGGVMLKRFYDTGKVFTQGYALSEGKGRLKYTVEPTVPNVLRSLAFGPNSTKEGREYVESDYDTASDNETTQFLDLIKRGYSPQSAQQIVRGQSENNKNKTAMNKADKQNEDTSALKQEGRDIRSTMDVPADMLPLSREEVEKPYMKSVIAGWQKYGDEIYPKLSFNSLPGELDEAGQQQYQADYLRNYEHIMSKYANQEIKKTDIADIKKRLSSLKKRLNKKYFGGD